MKDKVRFEDLIQNEVVIMQTSKCLEALESSDLNLIVIDDFHKRSMKQDISKIFQITIIL